jgi:glycosyltransferase involved in cell wall biosynthesis
LTPVNILFLTQVLPYPLDAGPKIRAYYTLRHLADSGHSLTLVSFLRSTDAPAAVEHLRSYCHRVVTIPLQRTRWKDGLALGRSLLTGEPLLIARDHSAPMYEQVQTLVDECSFDAVHADQLWMAPYALAARTQAERRGERPRLILDQHNAVFLIPRRLADQAHNPIARLGYRRESARMAAYEADICLAFDRVVTVTDEDRRYLLQLFRNGRRPHFSGVIPICLEPASSPLVHPSPDAAEILFIGGMHWPPNADGVQWFTHEILPRIRVRVPEARFTAVGKQPPRSLQTEVLAGHVHLPGYMASLEPYWSRSAVFVVPLRAGGGMRVKILDAWACGVPVVSTTVGAEGLACSPGHNLLLADSAEEFSQAVIQVLTDRALAGRLVQGGRATLEKHYDWRTVYAAWDEVYSG